MGFSPFISKLDPYGAEAKAARNTIEKKAFISNEKAQMRMNRRGYREAFRSGNIGGMAEYQNRLSGGGGIGGRGMQAGELEKMLGDRFDRNQEEVRKTAILKQEQEDHTRAMRRKELGLSPSASATSGASLPIPGDGVVPKIGDAQDDKIQFGSSRLDYESSPLSPSFDSGSEPVGDFGLGAPAPEEEMSPMMKLAMRISSKSPSTQSVSGYVPGSDADRIMAESDKRIEGLKAQQEKDRGLRASYRAEQQSLLDQLKDRRDKSYESDMLAEKKRFDAGVSRAFFGQFDKGTSRNDDKVLWENKGLDLDRPLEELRAQLSGLDDQAPVTPGLGKKTYKDLSSKLEENAKARAERKEYFDQPFSGGGLRSVFGSFGLGFDEIVKAPLKKKGKKSEPDGQLLRELKL